MDTHNTSAAGAGYIVTYDPSSKKVTRLAAKGFDSPRGLTPFGMDIVPSTHYPDELTIYVINMRPPFVDLDPSLPPGIREAKRDEAASALSKQQGPDPSIEVFRYILGGDSVQYVATWTDERVVISPNDVVGLPDGKGAWFTNPLPYRTGIVGIQIIPAAADALLTHNSRTLCLWFSSRSFLQLDSAGSVGANSLQQDFMASMGLRDPHLPQMTPSTLPTPSLAV